ncbi:PHP domain-containing protein [Lagierella sp.]|uniref:PHP domain-containing protein n=1 Tax=Lagierella sp. TaxID=2849657 RepID=UPI00260F0F80|nr:PHP domain-containing protein [Lagierella sp.]
MENLKSRIVADYHTHTIYSRNNHGKGTIRENVEKAVELGLKEIYITDHGPGHYLFGIRKNSILKARKEVDKLKEEFAGIIDIFLGVEANVIGYDGTFDITEEYKDYFDIINLGFHNGVLFKDFYSFFHYHVINNIKISKKVLDYITKKNTQAIIKIIEKENIFTITHPGDKVPVDIEMLASACERTNTALEINSSHRNLTVEQLKKIKGSSVMLTLGSDAHRPQYVGNLEFALRRLEEAKIDSSRVLNFKRRER